MSRESAGGVGRSLLGPFKAVGEVRTYKNLCYLLVGIPLSFLYWFLLGFGVTFGLVLSIVVVGLAVLWIVLAGARAAAALERWLANALLDAGIDPPEDRSSGSGMAGTVRGYVDAPSTWRALGFLVIRGGFGFFAVLLLALLASVLDLLAAPLRYPFTVEFLTVNGEPVGWTVASLPEAGLSVLVGLLLAVAALALSNAVAYAARRAAIATLGAPQTS